MREIDKIAEGLFEKIRDRFEDVSLGDEKAKATQDPEKARFFNFDYTVDDVNLGNVTLSIIDETSLKVYFSKNISDDLDDEQRHNWYDFLRELRRFAKSNLLSFEPRDITRSTLKHRDLQQVSKADSTYSKDEVVSESLYGTRKSSYERKGPVRIIVRHSKPLDEVENRRARTHHISNIYLETQEGERFKLPVKSLRLGRVLAQHLRQGGSMNDDLGRHICEIAEECAKLKPFLNNTRHRTFEDTETHAMVEAAFEYHGLLNNTLKRMTSKKGYQKCKEQFVATSTSFIPEVDTDEMKQRFEKRTFDDRLEEALPLVHKAYNMKKENKFAEQFENWADTIAEGTWAIPNTDEDIDKLIDILSNPLPVGVDGQNATNALYNLIGDDRLFDKFQEIAKIDPEQDVGNLVSDWLQDHLPNIYQQIEQEIGDPDYPAEPAEYDIDEGDTYGSGNGGMDGVVYEDDYDNVDDNEQVCVYCGTPRDDKLGCCDENHWVTKAEFDKDEVKEDSQDDDGGFEAIQSAIIRRIAHSHHELLIKLGPDGVLEAAREIAEYAAPIEEIGTSDVSAWVAQIERDAGIEKEVAEAKDTIKYDPKTGKLTGWEHEGDWKKRTKKDPVGKIHHMSDVARRRTEKMAKDETLEEAFERLVNEDTINIGDIIRKKDEPEIQGRVIRLQGTKYIINVEGEEYHIEQADAEKVKELNEDQVSDKLESFVGQTFYIPAEGQKGTVAKVADPKRFSLGLVVDLANGTTTVVHFKDLKPVEETPGPIKQLWQRLVATITGGATPKMQPKYNTPVSDINTPKQFQKLAGLK